MKNIPYQTELRSLLKPALLAGLLVLASVAPCHARGATYSLRELANGADLIGFGKVTAPSGDSVTVSIEEAVKGAKPSAEINIPTPPISPFDGGNPVYKVGDAILVFLVNRAWKYETAKGSQSIIAATPESRDSYREAIKLLSEYESATSTSTKAWKLGEMLRGKRASRDVALHILSLEPNSESNASLIKDVLPLTQDADTKIAGPATQVLGRIATKEEIPALADLAASPNKHVRQTARMALRTLTGNAMSGKEDDSDTKRKASIRDWKAWWAKNKDKVRLRK